MENIPAQNSQDFRVLLEILNQIKEKGDLTGVIYSYRDGNLIFENVKKSDFDGEKFSAMCASVLGSAEALGYTIRNQKIVKIISELENQTIMIIGCDEKTFLIFIFKNDSRISSILEELNGFIDKIKKCAI